VKIINSIKNLSMAWNLKISYTFIIFVWSFNLR